MPPASRPVPRDDLAAPPGRSASSPPRCSTTTACEPEPHLAGQRLVLGAVAARRGRAALDRRSLGRRRQRDRRAEAEAVAALARGHRRRRSSWIDERPAPAPDRSGGRPDRRPVQRPGRGDPAAPADPGAGRNGRQVPGPGGADQPLLDDDLVARSSRRAAWTSCTAGTASTWPPRGRAASRSWSPRPICSGSGRGRPPRCGSPTRFCRFAELAPPRRARGGAIEPGPGRRRGGPDAGPAVRPRRRRILPR